MKSTHQVRIEERSTIAVEHDSQLKISIVTTFDQIKDTWLQLENTGDCYAFQSFHWLSNWYRFIGKDELRPCIVLISSAEQQALALLPLGIQKHGLISRLTWLGGRLSDYHGPLICKNFVEKLPGHDFRTLWKEICDLLPPHDVVDFEKQPEVIGQQRNPFMYLDCQLHPSNAHFTFLSGPLEAFLKEKRTAKWRSSQRRKQRRLEENGPTVFICPQDQETASTLLEVMMQQKSISYQDMGVVDIFKDSRIREFFHYISKHHIGSLAHISALQLNNHWLATHWGLNYKNRFYFYLPTYLRSELTRYSPGTILLTKLFEWGMENNIDTFDFTVGDETYKNDWSNQELKLYDHIYASSFIGYFYQIRIKIQRWLKYKIKHSPRLFTLFQYLRKKIHGG